MIDSRGTTHFMTRSPRPTFPGTMFKLKPIGLVIGGYTD